MAIDQIQELGNQAVNTVQSLANTAVDAGQDAKDAALSIAASIMHEAAALVEKLTSKA
jgi:hypothetical protein